MATKQTSTIDELLGKLERQPLQIEKTSSPVPGLTLECDLRQLLSLNPDAALDQLQETLKVRGTTAASPKRRATVGRALSRDTASQQQTTHSVTLAVDPRESKRTHRRLSRNELCWCGSGKKYKKCHYPE